MIAVAGDVLLVSDDGLGLLADGTLRAALTRGERGAILSLGTDLFHQVPAEAVEDADTCGVGDRFASAAALALEERAALDSGASVTRAKGQERPIMRAEDRVDLLQALECVDAVVVFDEDTPHAVLGRLRPDIWVKGGDFETAGLPESALVRSWGGRTMTVPYHAGRSTTHLAAALARVG